MVAMRHTRPALFPSLPLTRVRARSLSALYPMGQMSVEEEVQERVRKLAQKHGFSESCGSWVFDWDPDSGYVCVRARTHAGMDGKVEGGMVTMMEGWCGV
jgi:hypothetical protein